MRGKDSLNLLLLSWRRRVRVLSAEPNYPLVKEFVTRNGLGYPVDELHDRVNMRLSEEILLNACANNLQGCRWTGHLRTIVESAGGRCVLWAGQLGCTLLTNRSRSYHAYMLISYGDSRVVNKVKSMADRVRRKYRDIRQALHRQGYFFNQ